MGGGKWAEQRIENGAVEGYIQKWETANSAKSDRREEPGVLQTRAVYGKIKAPKRRCRMPHTLHTLEEKR